MPICLPRSELFPDEEGQVYVAGWGLHAEKNCSTGNYGPDPYTMCAPHFKYNNMTLSGCTNISSPSSNDPLCKQLVKSASLTSFPEPGYTQTDIFDDKEKLLTTCYDFPMNNEVPYGWCATCQKHAKPGQPIGYCGNYPPYTNQDKVWIPTATKGWGYCKKECSVNVTDDRTLLQEVQLELLTVKECKIMGSSMKVMTDIELCAAKEVNIFLLNILSRSTYSIERI